MSWIVWVPLGVAGTGIYTVGLSWWLRERLYRTITAVRIALPLVSVLLQIAFVVLPDGTGIVVGSAVGQALIAVAVCVMILPAVARRAPPRRLALRGVALLKRFRGLALYTTPYSLQGQIFRHVVVVILVTLGSLETSGFFVMAQRLVYNPLTLIAAALEQATYPRLARSPRNPAIHRLIVATMRRMAILLGFGCALVTVFAHPVVVIVLGETWAPSAPYMVATCYAAASLVVSSWIVRVFDIFGRQKLHLIVDSLCNTAIVLIFVAAFLIWRDPVWAIVAWSAATAAYYAGWVVLAFHIAGMDTRPLISILLAAVAAWSATMVVCLLISRAFGVGILA